MGEIVSVDFSRGEVLPRDKVSTNGDVLFIEPAIDDRYDSLAMVDPESAREADLETAAFLIRVSRGE